MQPLVAGPRAGMTDAVVTAILRTGSAGAIRHGYGLELIDRQLAVVENISRMCRDGSVKRSSYATLHGTGRVQLAGELDWGSALVRPYYTLTDGTNVARWNLGAYYTSTPQHSTLTTPDVHDVDLYDVLSILDDPVADTYVVPAGTRYLDAVEQVLLARQVARYRIDATKWSTTLPADRVWKFDPQLRWLHIVNDLLAAIGYAGIFSDWDGYLVTQQYVTPRDRPGEWLFDTARSTTMLGGERRRIYDFYNAYNSWVFYIGTGIDTTTPVEGNGKFTFTNYTLGPTSVNARGRVITRPPEALDVADHASLLVAGQRIIDNDMIVPTRIETSTAAHPGSWHFDVLDVDDPVFGPPVKVVSSEWELGLRGHMQAHKWTVL